MKEGERERKTERNDREVKRGTSTGQQGYEDGVGRGVEGERAGKRKGRGRSSESAATGQEGRRRVEKRVA